MYSCEWGVSLKRDINFQSLKWLLMDVDGVMTQGFITYSASGDELKSFNVKDGQGIKYLKRAGFKIGIITGRSSPIVERRAMELQMDYYIQGREDKQQVFEQFLAEWQIQPDQVAYIGDDLPDLPILEKVGFSACPSDAVQKVIASCDFISSKKGGDGVVREVIDIIMDKCGLNYV